MSKRHSVEHALARFPAKEVKGFDTLAELALDLRSTWNHATDRVWRQLDARLWDATHNPWVVLQTVSHDRVAEVLSERAFRKDVEALLAERHDAASAPAWFQRQYPHSALRCVAYFSMEFMLSEALPIYSGGLGNVAGDQLKASSDLGVPVIGIGLLYQQGYFRQVIDNDGSQQALYPYNDPGQLPIMPLREPSGEWLRLEIALPGYTVWLRAWQARVGRTKLYLLDSNDAANYPAHRGITSELYGGGPELRLQQELLLGLGGIRLLDALGITPEVCHLNEGHAAFAVLERARNYMQNHGQPFEVALTVTRAGNLFTTHTAVPAGMDRFEPALIQRYLGGYAEQKLGITLHSLLALGRAHPDDATEPFNMAYLAARGSYAVNGVSRLHERVSQRVFQPLFPRWPRSEIPVGYVTNGVHMPSWDSALADELWTTACGKERWLDTTETLAQQVRGVSDATLWEFRNRGRADLVDYARGRLTRQLTASGVSAQELDQVRHLFDPNTLTVGFARRFATYKRPNMLLHDRVRLLRILQSRERPVQLIIAGKAHPQDVAGQRLIREWVEFIRQPGIRPHAVFLSDYDMRLTEQLVQGVDVWLNTPRRPWEACGTSGMKVLINGGLNLSVLDGWWAEAYSPDVGWALGDGHEHGEDPIWDEHEAEQLYDLLEHEVIPEFYQRDARGIPVGWVKRMRESMARLAPQFCSNRAVREYTEQHYIPAAVAYRKRDERGASLGKTIVAWQRALQQAWPAVRFTDVKVETREHEHHFEVHLSLGLLDPSAVRVELYADNPDGQPLRVDMTRALESVAADGGVYRATVSAVRPARDYTPRVVANCAGAAVPLEDQHILWHH